MLSEASKQILKTLTTEAGLDPMFCLAVAKVESDCTAFDTKGYPVVRFEKNVFIKYMKQNKVHLLDKAVSIQGASFDAYASARELDEDYAILSTSFGLYQIMGFNHRYVGYDLPKDFEVAMSKNIENQIEAFIQFVTSMKLKDAINNHDFKAFAEKYNGPMYYTYRYDTKLEQIFNVFSSNNGVALI